MAQQGFESSLAALERSTDSAHVQIQNAAKIINIKLDSDSSLTPHSTTQLPRPQSQAFREQWLLRWLLKRLAASTANQTSSTSAESFHLTNESWLLLSIIIDRIPNDLCLEILTERKAFQLFGQCLGLASSLWHQSSAGATQTSHIDQNHSQPPRKKRRVSNHDGNDRAQTHNGNTQRTPELRGLILNCLVSCGIVVGTNGGCNTGDDSVGPLSWASTPTEASTVLGLCLGTIVDINTDRHTSAQTLDTNKTTNAVLHFWNQHQLLANGFSQADINQSFADNCLTPALRNIDFLERTLQSINESQEATTALRKLVATHVVIPLRQLFMKEYSNPWKNAEIMDWSCIQPFHDVCRRMLGKNLHADSNMLERPNAPSELAYLLSVGIDLLPLFDIQKRKWESPWIDALFSVLCYLMYPTLPKMSAPESGGYTCQSVPQCEDSLFFIEEMLKGMQDQSLQLSAKLSSYFLCCICPTFNTQTKWSLVARIISPNADIVTSTGIQTAGVEISAYCWNALDLKQHSIAEHERELVKHKIFIPIMRAFARSRQLGYFASIWPSLLEPSTGAKEQGAFEKDSDGNFVSVWDDEELFDEFQRLAKAENGPELEKSLLIQIQPWIADQARGKARPSIPIYNIAILTAYLKSLEATEFQQSDMVGQLVEMQASICRSFVSEKVEQQHRWRIWMFLYRARRLHGMPIKEWIEMAVNYSGNHISVTSNNYRDSKFNSCFPLWQLKEDLSCFAFILELLKHHDSAALLECLRTRLNDFTELLQKFNEKVLNNELSGQDLDAWDGYHRNLSTTTRYISAFLARLLLHVKTLLKLPEISQPLYQTLIANATAGMLEETQECTQNTIPILCRLLITNSNIIRSRTSQECILANTTRIALFLHVPTKLIQQNSINRLTTTAIERLSGQIEDFPIGVIVNDLLLLNKLGQNLRHSLSIIELWKAWVQMIQNLDSKIYSAPPKIVMSNLDSALHPTILRCVEQGITQFWIRLSMLDQQTALPVLQSMCLWYKAQMQKPEHLVKNPLTLATLRLLHKALLAHTTPLEQIMSEAEVSSFQNSLMNAINQGFKSLTVSDFTNNNALRIYVMLKTIHDIKSAILTIKDYEVISDHLKSFFQQGTDDKPDQDFDMAARGIVSSLRSQAQLPNEHVKVPTSPTDVQAELERLYTEVTNEKSACTNVAMDRVARLVDGLVQKLSPSEYTAALTSGMQRNDQTRLAAGSVELLFIASIILRAKTDEISNTTDLGKLLSRVASLVTISRGCDVTQSLMHLDNSRLVLERHPTVINQFAIDSLLGAVCSLVSSARAGLDMSSYSGNSPNVKAEHVYDRVCGLIGVLLARYRRRLSDRFHLLLPCLQGMLRCLFYPGFVSARSQQVSTHSKSRTKFSENLPEWMRYSRDPLPLSSAQSFSRILISISNPTVSAARSSQKRGHSELNDEIQRTKRIAGQHLQYLIVEYARSSLDGQIQPDVKAGLTPGLYTVLDSMSRDLMRAMNSSMDPSSRAIFKILYDDWIRYGRWDKT